MNKLTPHQSEALDFNSHISLTANAGSGKTFVFAKRFVEIILSENVYLQNIIAITFTDKAAGELNRKIAREIEERMTYEKEKNKLRKLKYIRQRLVSANISTIHSFCIDLLKEYSPEAGLDANFVPIDARVAEDLLDLSIDESINDFIIDPELFEIYKYFVRLFGSKKFFRKQLVSLIEKRKTIIQLSENIYSLPDEKIAGYFTDLFKQEFEQIFNEPIKELLKSVKRINNNVLLNDPKNKIADEINIILGELEVSNDAFGKYSLLTKLGEQLLTKNHDVRKRDYARKDIAGELYEEISGTEKFYKDFRNFSFDEKEGVDRELIKLGKYFLQVFFLIEKKYTEKKTSRGYLDFEDILLHTVKLTSQKNVVNKLSEKYKYIMIDEYQDTNDVQYNIFMPILDNLKKGNLFVVGDEKQSIYMFRDADISVYQKTQDDLTAGSSDGRLLKLPHSFRMYPAIAAFTNKLFRNLFYDPKPIFNEVSHSELICAKESLSDGGIEFLVCDPENNVEEKDLLIGKMIELYLAKKDEGFSFGDIAVLCRKRNNFRELEIIMTENNIPYVVIGGRGFYQQQIVGDIYNYLSFLMDQKNDSALIGILRSPFFLFSDANLYDLSREEGRTYFDKLKKYVTSKKYFGNVLSILNDHIVLSATHEISALIRTILVDTGYWNMISCSDDSSRKIKNLEKLISLAANFSSQSFVTLYDFIRYLEHAIINIEDEGQALPEENIDAVKLMTIHQAKGLEFRAVFLYNCHEYGRETKLIAKHIETDKKYGILSKVYPGNKYFDEPLSAPIVALYNYVSGKRQLAELKRLLYVAVTRAVEYLFISGEMSENYREDSFMGLLKKGLTLDFSKDHYNTSELLQFMINSEGEYKLSDRTIELNIPIIKMIAGSLSLPDRKNNFENVRREINFSKINDSISNEIISATKISVFNQCPVKYQLTYELGYSDLATLVKTDVNTFDYKFKEDEETSGYGDLKGRIVHEILDIEPQFQNIEKEVDRILAKELSAIHINVQKEDIKKEIVVLLNKYYKSSTFIELQKFTRYYNEYEIYTSEKDFYLYGIIDKLIPGDDRIIIIDYKTDRIPAEEITNRGENYLPQLMFYANILRKKYSACKTFELRIIFLNHPEKVFSRTVSEKELSEFNDRIYEIVASIRNNNYTPNKNHCYNCQYSVGKGICIKEKL